MFSYCNAGHLKSPDNLIGNNKCKRCRYARQFESRQRLLKARSLLINQYKSVPCTDCLQTFPPFVLDFDHVKGKKYRNISKMADHNSWDKILEEIAKCEVVCSNCHRVRTHNRRKKSTDNLDKPSFNQYNK